MTTALLILTASTSIGTWAGVWHAWHRKRPVVRNVDPAEIVRQRELGWPAFHPERYCHECGNKNIWSWSVDSTMWNAVMADQAGTILCPTCFTEHAASAGYEGTWSLNLNLQRAHK